MAKSELFNVVKDVIKELGYDAYVDETLGRLPVIIKFNNMLKPSEYVNVAMEIEDGIIDGYDLNVDVEPTTKDDEITINYAE